jgi:hypothetical protein
MQPAAERMETAAAVALDVLQEIDFPGEVVPPRMTDGTSLDEMELADVAASMASPDTRRNAMPQSRRRSRCPRELRLD